MFDRDHALTQLTDLIASARRAGADAADAVFAESGSTDVQVRMGTLEDVGRAESSGVGLRVFVGTRSASASSSDLSREALGALVERTVAMARLAPEDPHAGLADPTLVARGALPDLDLDDGAAVTPEALRDLALATEAAALAVPGVTNSQGGSASASRSLWAIATSSGFAGAQVSSMHGISATALAGEGGTMQRDYASHSVRHAGDLDPAASVGERAGARAVARLNPERLPSGPLAVVFDARVASSLLGHLIGAISGSAIARGTSFLKDRLGTRMFRDRVGVIDDPLRQRGLRSRAFDGEGLAAVRSDIIADGVLTQWLADAASARQLGIAPTGHAVRGLSGAPGVGTSNLHMTAGTQGVADLIADIGHGFLVTELIGMGVNGLTGDYSRGASGFAIREGRVAGAVSEVTIAGNLIDMFAAARPADDLEFRHATNAPTLRIDGMTLAGA
jgi:PmbA protein